MKYHHFARAAVATGLLLSFCSGAFAQSSSTGGVELIVRPSNQSGAALQSVLSGGRSKSTPSNVPDSLFEGVQAVSAIGGGDSASRKSAGTNPSPLGAYRLSVSDSTTLRRLLGHWENRDDVAYAHPNYTFEVERGGKFRRGVFPHLRSDNAVAGRLDHLEVIRAIDAWSNTQGNNDVKIGVVDTGFYLNHPDLTNQFWVNEEEDVSGSGRPEGDNLNGTDDDGNGYVDDVIGYDFVDRASPLQEGEFADRDPDPSTDPNGQGSGHGTSVAAIATGSPGTDNGIAGVAPDTRLVALRAFGGDGFGEVDDIAAAIAYAAETDVDVLNLSFGRSKSVPVIRNAIEYAHEQGVVIVGSAGNTLTDDPHYPSDYPEVLSVVWLAEDGDGLPDANRSQFGIGVDIGAPGSNVYTANFPASALQSGRSPTQEELYHNPSGSSFSAPQVAGAAALLRSADSSLSPASVRSILTATAEDLTAENWDHRTGSGLLNVDAALKRAYPARTEINRPDNNEGVSDQETVPVVGTALDPSFAHYSVLYAEGTSNLDDRPDPWTEIVPPQDTQMRRDTLARWDVGALSEGEYTLRLVTTLQDGRTIEDRRRVIVDRSPPSIDVEFLAAGRVRGHNGIVADLKTDDRTRLRTTLQHAGSTDTLRSERVTRRHTVTWPDEEGRGGPVDVAVEATNTSGLMTTRDTTLQVPPSQENTALLRRTETSVPRGTLMPTVSDFDADGLSELVLNQSADGGVSDTLRSFEWRGEDFAPVDTLIASYTPEDVGFAPRDVGDTDNDGQEELLLQIREGTLLLEQESSSAFPARVVFADTVQEGRSSTDVVSGIQLTNLDGDAKGEILGSQLQQLEVLERASASAGADFQSVLQLTNPTSTDGRNEILSNLFDAPNAGTGDFDDDERRDVLVGDRDGDLVVYESTGDDAMKVAWTHETARTDAGNRFAVGNFAGGSVSSFATAATSSSFTHYSVWSSVGDDQYERVFRLPIAGPYSPRGAMTAADVDGDGRDEVIVAHAPSLLVLDRTGGGTWRVLYQNDEGLPLQSRRLVAADFNGTGAPSILAESAGETLVRFVVNDRAVDVAPPQWTYARPGGVSSAKLAWAAPGADSVTVYAGPPDGDLDSLSTQADSSYEATGGEPRRYALRAWEGGKRSPLSRGQTVRPHPPATVETIEHPSPTTARLTFTEPLRTGLEPEQFELGAEARTPERLVQSRESAAVVLRFPDAVADQEAVLRWSAFRDRTGLAVGQTQASLSFPRSEQRSLFVEQATVLDESRVRLRFNKPLAAAAATERDRYSVQPRGRVASIQQSDDASVVTLRVEGLVLGPNGQESSLSVEAMKSADGSQLAAEGTTVRLTKPANDLSNVFIYPNPYRAQSHDGAVTIAGLPNTSTIRIYSPDGRLVRKLNIEGNRNGGAAWDLRNRRGELVPAGVYLFRVNAPDQRPVLEKAAIVR